MTLGWAFYNAGLAISVVVVGFVLNWRLIIIVFLLTPIAVLISLNIGKYMAKYGVLMRKFSMKAGCIAEETFFNFKTVSSFGNYTHQIEKYKEASKEELKVGLRKSLKTSILIGVAFFVIGCGYIIDSGLAPTVIKDADENGHIDPFDVLIILNCFLVLTGTLSQSIPYFKNILNLSPALVELYKLEEELESRPQEVIQEEDGDFEFGGDIIFKEVVFKYKNVPDKIVLKGVNMTIEQGKMTAIVGPSGSGKSTVIYLIERLYNIESGSIEIGGRDIRSFPITKLRSYMGYVPQEPMLFNNSIRENILMGRTEFTEEDLQKACERALINDFAGSLDKGLDTIVGVKGSKLSGGQKQRIAIARALISNPKILLLDEATSALDNLSEKEVQTTITKLSKEMTVIIIAHRLNTIKDADKIIVIQYGNVVEEGTNEQLISNQGIYYNLIKEELHSDSEPEKLRAIDDERASTIRKDASIKQSIFEELERKEMNLPEESKFSFTNFKSIIKLTFRKRLHTFLAFASSIALGTYYSIQALLITNFAAVLFYTPLTQLVSTGLIFILYFGIGTIVSGFSNFLQK